MSQKTINTIFYFGCAVLGIPTVILATSLYGMAIHALVTCGFGWQGPFADLVATFSAIGTMVVSSFLIIYRLAEGKFPWEG